MSRKKKMLPFYQDVSLESRMVTSAKIKAAFAKAGQDLKAYHTTSDSGVKITISAVLLGTFAIGVVALVLAILGETKSTKVDKVLAPKSYGVALKAGNNGTVNCAQFCNSNYYDGPTSKFPSFWRGATSAQYDAILIPTPTNQGAPGICVCHETPDAPFTNYPHPNISPSPMPI
jgi:hypothetical protein